MAALSAISSATPSLQASLARTRLEAARREADQAESEVQTLRDQVASAEAQSQQRQQKVRSLSSQVGQQPQSDPTYARLGQAVNEAPLKTQAFLEDLVQTAYAIKGLYPTASSSATAVQAFGNTSQTVGRFVNISA